MSRPEVTTLGETMASLHGQGPLRMGGALSLSVAGAEANVAIGLARLGHAARYAGVVGDDEFGLLVTRTLRAEGVDTAVRVDPGRPTGLIVQENRIAGITRVHYYRDGSAGATLSAADASAALADPPRLLHVTGITPALGPAPRAAVEHAVRLARDAGVRVSLDVNHRARLWDAETAAPVLAGLLPYTDLLFASGDELALVGGREAVAAAGVGELVVKHGADGAEAVAGGETVRLPARRVQAVSTVGAGDAFVAGYLSGVLDGLPAAGRLGRAVTVGAFAVAAHGDWHGLPTRAELALLDLGDGSTVR
ncbi:ribokinase [Microtetraspora sp. NBRC 13810]|uniref:sugar kinase n=1 Tax=Microtetraspora sp. NBRC 13810 TaxID=3030990 RepID=UPI0024A382D8|nr:sugar kinase [Microtetraspora sp. NBRC 13810]GLW07410.1 ribokinase [Microtetraspora sp. NBRC 13810]